MRQFTTSLNTLAELILYAPKSGDAMRLALIGCGYVADFYMATLANHPELEVLAVMDIDALRADRFARFYKLRNVRTLEEVLADPRVDTVVNLTNPASHFEVSKAALEAGKHVYSEKPLATDFSDARELVELAERRGLQLAGAPCTVLGEAAQTAWKALRHKAIGKVRLVYAEMDDGPIYARGWEKWISASGTPWPAKDEFEVGCTLEHAGYCLTWLAAFFGPATWVTSFATCLVPDKGIPLDRTTADLTVACIEFASGVVARLTCSLYAPLDHRMRVIGDDGVLVIEEVWNADTTVRIQRRGSKLHMRAERHPRLARLVGLGPRVVRPVRKKDFQHGSHAIDFARGIAEVASALREGRPSRMSSRFALHVNEIVLAIEASRETRARHPMTTTFDAIQPMPWAD
jgi:predicted dehydrogenase